MYIQEQEQCISAFTLSTEQEQNSNIDELRDKISSWTRIYMLGEIAEKKRRRQEHEKKQDLENKIKQFNSKTAAKSDINLLKLFLQFFLSIQLSGWS